MADVIYVRSSLGIIHPHSLMLQIMMTMGYTSVCRSGHSHIWGTVCYHLFDEPQMEDRIVLKLSIKFSPLRN